MIEHAELLSAWQGETGGMRAFRKHATWYTKGFSGSSALRERLCRVSTLAGLREALASLDRCEPFPRAALRVPRGKRGGQQKVALPEGFLENRWDRVPPEAEALEAVSGG